MRVEEFTAAVGDLAADGVSDGVPYAAVISSLLTFAAKMAYERGIKRRDWVGAADAVFGEMAHPKGKDS